jgi:hypothetical protein
MPERNSGKLKSATHRKFEFSNKTTSVFSHKTNTKRRKANRSAVYRTNHKQIVNHTHSHQSNSWAETLSAHLEATESCFCQGFASPRIRMLWLFCCVALLSWVIDSMYSVYGTTNSRVHQERFILCHALVH